MRPEDRLADEKRRLLADVHACLAAGDRERARQRLEELHWFGHDDPEAHAAVHRIEFALAREDGDRAAMARVALPVVFAGLVARFERLGYERIAEVRIAAPASVVYDVIADVARYAEWNPWLVRAEGEARVGASVEADVVLGDATVHAGHRVLVTAPAERFAWCDTGWFTPLVRGRRFRSLFDAGGETLLVTRLVVAGPFAPLAWGLYGAGMERGLAAESLALKARAEAMSS